MPLTSAVSLNKEYSLAGPRTPTQRGTAVAVAAVRLEAKVRLVLKAANTSRLPSALRWSGVVFNPELVATLIYDTAASVPESGTLTVLT